MPTAASEPSQPGGSAVRDVLLAVHGGAGTVPRGGISTEREHAYHEGLTAALRAGQAGVVGGGARRGGGGGGWLGRGGRGRAAVEAAGRELEAHPNFNAGRGAVFTADAGHEL